MQHCTKTLYLRSKENRLVIQIQKALWRKLEPLFSCDKSFALHKTEVQEIALASEDKSCRPETNLKPQLIDMCVSQCETNG